MSRYFQGKILQRLNSNSHYLKKSFENKIRRDNSFGNGWYISWRIGVRLPLVTAPPRLDRFGCLTSPPSGRLCGVVALVTKVPESETGPLPPSGVVLRHSCISIFTFTFYTRKLAAL
jgi:hypothetical protein